MKGKTSITKYGGFIAALLVFIFLFFHFVLMPYGMDRSEDSAMVWTQASQEETQAQGVDKTSHYLILVNKKHRIHSDYVPNDLVPLTSAATQEDVPKCRMRRVAAEAFERLAIEARGAGYSILAISAFQTGAEETEYQTGLAVDVSAPSVQYQRDREFGNKAEGRWLAQNAYKYGFIIRHPKGKKHITGYSYEPWHLRYVGRDAAREIQKQALTLEEYLGER